MVSHTPGSVREALARLRLARVDWSLAFSGERSQTVNGFYTPDKREIVINDNFSSDEALIYTAIHEYAHHIAMTEYGVKLSSAHSPAFWYVFYALLSEAERQGLYSNPFKDGFYDTTEAIVDLLQKECDLMKDVGALLIAAKEKCDGVGARFEDYVERELRQSMPWAKTCMRSAVARVPSDVGPESMRFLCSVKNPYTRRRLVKEIRAGWTIMQAKASSTGLSGLHPKSKKEERDRLEKSIAEMSRRLVELEG
jgi:hypothetical protein